MKSELISLIMNRTSYRGEFAKKEVPDEHLDIILRAGLAAPSGCNKQTTSLIAVSDKDLLQKIKSVIDPPVFSSAPAIICVLTEKVYAYRDKCYNVQDYSASIQNMLLAINALGYESCWYEGHITDEDDIAKKISDILNVPDNISMVCVLPVGKALNKTNKVNKKSFEERAWYNGYKK